MKQAILRWLMGANPIALPLVTKTLAPAHVDVPALPAPAAEQTVTVRLPGAEQPFLFRIVRANGNLENRGRVELPALREGYLELLVEIVEALLKNGTAEVKGGDPSAFDESMATWAKKMSRDYVETSRWRRAATIGGWFTLTTGAQPGLHVMFRTQNGDQFEVALFPAEGAGE